MTRYTPTVSIGGTPVAAAWDGSQVAAIARIGINWGRSSMFEDPEPTALEFHVIDPDGRWSGDPTLYDQRVVIAVPELDGRRIFQGDVTGVTSRRTKVSSGAGTDGAFGSPTTWVWMTKITAAAPDAALRRLVVPGIPMTDSFTHIRNIEWYGLGYWRYNAASESAHGTARVAQLMAGGASAHVDSMEVPTDAKWRYLIKGSDNASAHEVMSLGYRGGIAGGHANYRPDTNALVCGRPAPAGALSLAYSGGVLRLASASGVIVPASAIGVPDDGPSITSTVRDAIDTVSVDVYDMAAASYTEPISKNVWSQSQISASTYELTAAVPGVASKTRTLSVKTAHISALASVTSAAVETGARPLLSALVQLAQFLNGKTVPDGLYYDFDRFPELGTDLDNLLFNTFDVETPLYFVGSIAADFPNHGPFFQIIGGTLEFRDGWRVSLTLAPAPSTPGAEVTYANWVTNTAATYEQFADTITWADFAVVTQGAS